MSKGLEALEELKECIKLEGALDYINEERINIIEKELKELEVRRQMMRRFNEACVPMILENETEQKLKAIEIIKNKPWLVGEIVESKGDYKAYKSWCSVFRTDMKYRATEEEFNLLKEVLCCYEINEKK